MRSVGGGLSLYRAAKSNLRMVRPSLMSVPVVKLVIILDLASYLAVMQEALSLHFSLKLEVTVTLFSCMPWPVAD